jgi:sec-independent protein translocase protein TatB
MFDIGFSELMVIGVVALVVIGPERLPRVARTAGLLIGRAQRYVNDVKADISREIELDELRKFKKEVEDTAQSFETSVRSEVQKTQDLLDISAKELASEVQGAASSVQSAIDHITAPPTSPAPAISSTPVASSAATPVDAPVPKQSS